MLPRVTHARLLLMKWLLFPLLILSSCAYVQTHRNVAESFRSKPGYSLHRPIEQGAQQGRNYLLGHRETLRKHYPNVFDSILLTDNNEVQWRSIERGQPCLLPLSDGTAMVLKRRDGYAYTDSLLDEIRSEMRKGQRPITGETMPATHPVVAQVDRVSQQERYLDDPTIPDEKLSFPEELLVQADRVIIDWPLTLAYNVAIPFMAPVIFFSEFLDQE